MPAVPTAMSEETAERVGVAGGLLAVSAWGVSGVVAKHITMGGLAIASYRFALYGIVVSAVMTARGVPITRRVLSKSMRGGIVLGVDVALFFSAIKLTSIANATVIGALQPVLVALIAHRWFGERIRTRDMGLGAVALLGAVVVVLGAPSGAEAGWRGDLLALGALLAWSGYFILSKQAKGVISSNEYTVGVALWAGLVNAPLALAFGQSLSLPSAQNWLWLAALAFGAGVFGHAVMNWSLQQIPLWLGSTLTLLVPVVSAATAWIFLGEPLTGVQIAAMAVVILSLGGVITGRSTTRQGQRRERLRP